MRRLLSSDRGFVLLTLALAAGFGLPSCGGDDGGGGTGGMDAGSDGAREGGDAAPRPDSGGTGGTTIDGGGGAGGQTPDTGLPEAGGSTSDGAVNPDAGDATIESGTGGSTGTGGSIDVDGATGGGGSTGTGGSMATGGSGGELGTGGSTGTGGTVEPPDSGIPDAGEEGGGLDAASDADSSLTGPRAAFPSTAIDFGTGNCGASAAARELVVQNTGTGGAPLTVDLSVTGATFTISPATQQSIPAGQSKTFTLNAAVPSSATAGTALSGSLKVTTNDTTHASTTIGLSVVPQGGTLVWNQGSLTSADFGIAQVGTPDDNIALTLRNSGNAAVTVELGTPSNNQFSIVSPTKAQSVAAGGTLQLTAGFTPTSLQTVNATSQLKVTGAVCGTSVTSVALAGRGGNSALTGWPSSTIDFGAAPCGGAAPAARQFKLHNDGTLAAKITGAKFSGAVGYTTDAANKSIAAGGDLTVTVSAPAIPQISPVPGSYDDSLTITTDSAGDNPHVIALTEQASGAILAWDTAATTDFGSFGLVPVGTTSTHLFRIVNSGNAPSKVTVTTTTPFSVGFDSLTVDGASAGDNTVAFAPMDYKGASSTLAMIGTGLCQPLPGPIALAGVGQAGGIAISEQALSFASKCGTAAPAPRDFTITNSGNASMTFQIALANGTAFDVVANKTSLAPSEVATITVTPRAVPVDPAVLSDDVKITTNILGDSVHTVSLAMTPLGDVVTASPVVLNLGDVPVVAGTSEVATGTFELVNNANTGSDPAIVNITSGDSHFTVDTPLVKLGPGQTQKVTVTFAPGITQADAIERTNTVFVALDAADATCRVSPPGDVAVSGRGTLAQVALSAPLLDFGLVNCGGTASPQQLVVSNTGTQAFNVTGVTVDNPTHYTLSTPADTNVPAGGSLTLTVTPNAIPGAVNPVPALKTFSGALTIHTNAEFEPADGRSVQLSMGAKGVIIDNTLGQTSWSFGTVRYGATGTYNVGIRNRGNATAQASLDNTSPVFRLAQDPTIIGASDGSVAVSTTVSGTFTPNQPTGTWNDTGTLTVVPTTGEVFCAPLPQSWNAPTLTLLGSASDEPVITVSGPIAFPSTYCDAVAPPPQSTKISNSGNSAVSFTASLDVGTYYAIAPTTGSVAPNGGSAMIQVTPTLPPTGVAFPGTGTTPYDERLRIEVGGNTYVVPISMTVSGAVLSASTRNDIYRDPYARYNYGPTVIINNAGNLSATVTPVFSGVAGFLLSPSGGSVGANASLETMLMFRGYGCIANGTLSFSATGAHLCQNSTALAVMGCN